MRRLLVLAATAAGLFASEAAAQAAPVRIRLGTLAPQGSSYHRTLQDMAEKWKAATNGQVQVTIYAGTMGSELELIRRMRAGQLQAAVVSTQGVRSIDPGVQALQSMPLVFRSLEELDYVKAKVGPTLDARIDAKGFKVLFWADAGWVRFFSRERIEKPEELKRLRTFVTAGETEQFELMKSSGYGAVALEWADALTGLQTKMVDVVPTIPYFALATQVYTVANHMLDLNWAPVVGALIVNKKTWDAFPDATRAALGAIALEAGKKFQEQGRTEAAEAVAAMQKRGLTVVPMTPAMVTEWRGASDQLLPKVRGGMVPADMYDEVMRAITEYRSRQPR